MANLLDKITEPYRLSLESTYNTTLSTYFKHDIIADITISLLITVAYYWILGLLYTFLEITRQPAFLYRYKIQSSSQITPLSLSRLFRRVLSNQILGSLLTFTLLSIKYGYIPKINRNLPTLSRFALEWTVFLLLREALFYYSHRALHHPLFYKRFHKQHHEWQTTVALAAMYCHPVDHVVSNMLPVIVGPLVMGSHSLVGHLWLLYVVTLTLSNHSGYHFPLNPFSPIFHDFHHLKFNVNYGILGLLDWLHGTDRLFRESKYYKLDRIFFGWTPPEELYYNADKMD